MFDLIVVVDALRKLIFFLLGGEGGDRIVHVLKKG